MSTPPQVPLERGKACLRCRRRKMRCDGSRPACGQCVRADRSEDCEYTDGSGPTQTQILEQEVHRLQGRIAELENSTASPLTLHDPYANFHNTSHALTQPGGLSTVDVKELLRAFVPHASEYGFFLHIPRFLEIVYGAVSPHGPRYPAVLMDSVYLVAAQFCESSELKAKQSALLNQALQDLPAAMLDSGSVAVIYALQAEVLLSNYFFNNDRKLEGAYHANAAVSIVLACKFQNIRSSRQQPTVSSTYILPPPRDAIEEGERINAFWTVFILDRSWTVVMGSAPGLTDDATTGTQIDIPWPLDMSGYENHRLTTDVRSCHTVQTFLRDATSDRHHPGMLAMHAKAAALYDQATRLASQAQPTNPASQQRLTGLDGRIESFKRSIPPLDRVDSNRPDVLRSLAVVHLLTRCALINLHLPLMSEWGSSSERANSAAKSVVAILRGLATSGIEIVNPILGILCLTAAQVVLRAMAVNQNTRAGAVSMPDAAALQGALNQINANLVRWSTKSPLMRNQINIIHQAQAGRA